MWNYLPVSDHLSLPGVQAVARVGRYDAELQAGGRSAGGELLAIDRTDFPQVAFFRRDFASEPLITLMNRLAYDPAALLVDRGTWERFHLSIGDTVQLRISLEQRQTLDFKVAGVMEYFPTQYPEEGPFFVGNLDYLFESTGGLQPYDVWLRTSEDADPQAIVQGVNNLGVAVIRAQDARLLLAQTFQAPNRQGVLGLLSVGFLSALLLTVVGFLLYATLFLPGALHPTGSAASHRPDRRADGRLPGAGTILPDPDRAGGRDGHRRAGSLPLHPAPGGDLWFVPGRAAFRGGDCLGRYAARVCRIWGHAAGRRGS